MTDSIYKSIITSRTENQIPVLQNGRTVESKYNPEREAEQIIQTFDKNLLFFIIIGIGSGILIQKITEEFPEAKIIGVEKTDTDISFLHQLKTFNIISQNKNVSLCSSKKLSETIINNYVPALHGNMKIFENKAWINENSDCIEDIQNQIQAGLKKVSSDFSVQAHFGKIWQNNILSNLKLLSNKEHPVKTKKADTSKTAAIIAAGPSLDNHMEELKKSNYFIIATDTAYSILQKYNLSPDIAVSLDGQYVSYNHFLGETKNNNITDFYFDLSCNPSSSKYIDKKNSLTFFTSGHPLSEYANFSQKQNLLKLYSGSGTVTITALDLALKLGFTKIKVFGADFSYPNNKPYAKGTYLDTLYGLQSNRLNTSEQTFTKLMFRTPLINGNTTEVLEAYKESFEDYLRSIGADFDKKDFVYQITIKNRLESKKSGANDSFDFQKFISELKTDNNNEIILLPYIAWLRKNSKFSDNNYKELYNIARKTIDRYN